MPTADDRRFFRVDLEYRLCFPTGMTPDTKSKTWFFEVPAARCAPEAWAELLHRIFYDANVCLGRSEPNDVNWLGLDRFTTKPVEPAPVLGWDGKTAEPFPWIAAERARVWEPGPCYFVDDAGRYDVMSAHDYTELLMQRQLRAGKIDPAGYVNFFERYFNKKPGSGRQMYDERDTRFANLAVVRAVPGPYRKPPGSGDCRSGPVDPALRG